jgi:hypothetical protein
MATFSARLIPFDVIELAMNEFCNKLEDLDIDDEERVKILKIFAHIGRQPGSAIWMSQNFRRYVGLMTCPFAKLTLMLHHSYQSSSSEHQ